VHEWIDGDSPFLLIDTLPDDHFNKVHIPGAVNACVYTVTFLEQIAEIGANREETIILYGSGNRSRDALVAAEKLDRAGFKDIKVLEGGLELWRQAGYRLAGERAGEEDSPATMLELDNGTYALETEQSVIEWAGRNQNSTHFGTVRCSSGELTIAESSVTGRLSVDMNTIENVNLAGDELQPVLEAHLKSDDFFFVERFSTATLIISDGKIHAKPYLTSSNCTLRGKLTLHGVTADLQFDATLTTGQDGALLLEAHFDLDRTRWGIIYGSARFFEFLGMHQVFDDISIQMRLRLSRK
jgi:polyisoprenoid-binding protein YceI/rhodanese-related sulfurtransferase